MALETTFKDTAFGIGDRIKILQKIKEGEKTRNAAFEGIVISIKGRDENKTVTIRRIGAANVGIERIFPLSSPTLQSISVTRKGKRGVRRAKLYFVREKSKREIEGIYSKSLKRERSKEQSAKKKESSKKSK